MNSARERRSFCWGGDGEEDLASDFEPLSTPLDLSEFCLAVGSTRQPAAAPGDVYIPGRAGVPTKLEQRDVSWYSEEFDLLHSAAGQAFVADSEEPGMGFLKGRRISWYEIEHSYDIQRDCTTDLRSRVEALLSTNRAVRFNIYHEAGAGGTTVARRVVWDLRGRCPTAELKVDPSPTTVEKVAALGEHSGLAPLILIEGATANTRAVDDLYELLRSRGIACILLHVLRRIPRNHNPSNSATVRAQLSGAESQRFAHRLQRHVPNRARAILDLSLELDKCTPFMYGLTAYQEEFRGVERFVRHHLANIPGSQRKVLALLSLVFHYSQRTVPLQLFASELGVEQAQTVASTRHFAPSARALVVEDLGEQIVRPLHDVVAREIVVQVLTENVTLDEPQLTPREAADQSAHRSNGQLWKQRLGEWAGVLLGVLSRGGSQELETAKHVFVFRDNEDVIGTEKSKTRMFSRLVEDIPASTGRYNALVSLADEFPDIAHFWGHLGRFCAFVLHNYGEAKTHINRAIEIEPDGGVLHHMKGMIIRGEVRARLEDGESVDSTVELALEGIQAFTKARELLPDREHGYVSEIQFRCRIMDEVAKQAKRPYLEAAASATTPSFVRECAGRAESLLSQLRALRGTRRPSRFENQCRASLDAIYQEYDAAIQKWESLIDDPSVYTPPVRRQIVWTYLNSAQRSWRNLRQKHRTKALRHLEENLDAEPGNERDLRLWVRGIRHSPKGANLSRVAERIEYWRAATDSVDATYYAMVLCALRAIDGSGLAAQEFRDLARKLQETTRYRHNRTSSFEWLGEGPGFTQLVHQSELGAWDQHTNFWYSSELLRSVQGRICEIRSPTSGHVEFGPGLQAFFSPGRSGFRRARDENARVRFFLGFSFEGLRAWSVEAL